MRNSIKSLLSAGLCFGIVFSASILAADLRAGDSVYNEGANTTVSVSPEVQAAGQDIDYHYETPLRSLEVRRQGTVEFSKDYDEVTAISPDGYLLIKERHWFTTRVLEVTADGAGKPLHRFSMRGRSLEFDERAKEWLRAVMPEIVVRTGIDAEKRVAELLSRGGPDAVFREISHIEYNRAKRIYFLKLVETGNLSDEDMLRVIRVASKEISSSSQLNQLLSELAEKFPPDPRFSAEFFRGAEAIPSGSEKRAAIENIARSRQMDTEAGVAMGRSIRTISSSSEKARALGTMAKFCPAEDAVISAYLEAAESINSSSECANALAYLCERKDLSNRGWVGIARTAGTITSSSESGRVLREMAAACPTTDDVARAYLDSAFDIMSSSEKEEALAALLQREGLSQSILTEILKRANSEITSSSSRQAVVEMVSKRMNVN